VSYYNPAPVPEPGGVGATGTASVSYYNPSPIPDPDGIVAAGVTSVSYFNPETPAPEGAVAGVQTSTSKRRPFQMVDSIENASGRVETFRPEYMALTRRQLRW
jgi:hypothetical protein